MIVITNKKLVKYIEDKDALVTEGRKVTREMESIETKIKNFETQEKLITGKVKPSPELGARGDALVEEINRKIKELEVLGKEVEEQKLSAVPKEMKDEHMALLKKNETLERERNKIALKIQKIKDRLIPIIQKEVKPLLETEFDDIETAKVKDGKVYISTFNHLEDFKSKFKKR